MAVYKYKLPYDVIIERQYTFLNKQKYVTRTAWGDIETGGSCIKLHAFKDYAWDGCSPKIKVGSNVIGIWDGFTHSKMLKPKTYFASLAHDLLYQLLPKHNLTRKEADLIFYELLKEADFELPNFYYGAVRLFGRVALNLGGN